MDALSEIVRLVLPLLTFGAGFILNAWLERRRRKRTRAEMAIRDLISALHDWHAAWRTFMATCVTAKGSDELIRAFYQYQERSTIARKADFALSILTRESTTKFFAERLKYQLSGNGITTEKLSIDSHELDVTNTQFEDIDSALRHLVKGSMLTLFLPPDGQDAKYQKHVDRIRLEFDGRFSHFENMMVIAQEEAADMLARAIA